MRSLKGIDFVGCEACDLCKLALSLMKDDKLLIVFNLLISFLIAKILNSSLPYIAAYFGQERIVDVNVRSMRLNWKRVVD